MHVHRSLFMAIIEQNNRVAVNENVVSVAKILPNEKIQTFKWINFIRVASIVGLIQQRNATQKSDAR